MSCSIGKRWYIWKNNMKKCFRQKLYDIDEGHPIFSSIWPSDDLKRSCENQIKISKSTSFITYFRRWNWDISVTSPTRAFHPLSRYEIQIRRAMLPTLALLYIHKCKTAGIHKDISHNPTIGMILPEHRIAMFSKQSVALGTT